eukprot:jgi/Ulvmu1/4305/UM002_0026.1
MNWVVPLAVLSSVSVIIISAVITFISLRDPTTQAIRRDFGAVSGPICIGSASQSLSARSRDLLLPQYTKCIRWPQFAAGDAEGGCSSLHIPTKKQYKHPTPEFRNVSQVTIDASECQSFVDDFAPPNLDRAHLRPFNVTLRPQSTDHAVFLQVFCGGDFGFMARLSEYLPMDRPVSFLDAGANIGMASILFSQLIMGNGQVLSVEANPETAEVLRSNLASLQHVAVPVQAALVDSATAEAQKTLTFKGRGSEYWGFRVDHNGVKQEDTVAYEVETRTMAQIRRMATFERLDFIKLDVEGEEKWLLKDRLSREVLCSAICIFMELHERMEQGCNAAFQDFMKNGCTGEQMEEVVRTGEYILVCHKKPEVR